MSDEDKKNSTRLRNIFLADHTGREISDQETTVTLQASTVDQLIKIVISITSDEKLIKSRYQLSSTIYEVVTVILLCKRSVKEPKHKYKNKKGEDKQMDINAIPNNMEKYMAFLLGKHLIFLNFSNL